MISRLRGKSRDSSKTHSSKSSSAKADVKPQPKLGGRALKQPIPSNGPKSTTTNTTSTVTTATTVSSGTVNSSTNKQISISAPIAPSNIQTVANLQSRGTSKQDTNNASEVNSNVSQNLGGQNPANTVDSHAVINGDSNQTKLDTYTKYNTLPHHYQNRADSRSIWLTNQVANQTPNKPDSSLPANFSNRNTTPDYLNKNKISQSPTRGRVGSGSSLKNDGQTEVKTVAINAEDKSKSLSAPKIGTSPLTLSSTNTLPAKTDTRPISLQPQKVTIVSKSTHDLPQTPTPFIRGDIKRLSLPPPRVVRVVETVTTTRPASPAVSGGIPQITTNQSGGTFHSPQVIRVVETYTSPATPSSGQASPKGSQALPLTSTPQVIRVVETITTSQPGSKPSGMPGSQFIRNDPNRRSLPPQVIRVVETVTTTQPADEVPVPESNLKYPSRPPISSKPDLVKVNSSETPKAILSKSPLSTVSPQQTKVITTTTTVTSPLLSQSQPSVVKPTSPSPLPSGSKLSAHSSLPVSTIHVYASPQSPAIATNAPSQTSAQPSLLMTTTVKTYPQLVSPIQTTKTNTLPANQTSFRSPLQSPLPTQITFRKPFQTIPENSQPTVLAKETIIKSPNVSSQNPPPDKPVIYSDKLVQEVKWTSSPLYDKPAVPPKNAPQNKPDLKNIPPKPERAIKCQTLPSNLRQMSREKAWRISPIYENVNDIQMDTFAEERKPDQQPPPPTNQVQGPNDTSLSIKAPSGGLRVSEWADVEGDNRPPVRAIKREKESSRRHTVGGDNLPVHNISGQNYPVQNQLSMDHQPSNKYNKNLADIFTNTQRSLSLYQPNPFLYDDDPGIMSEAETSATGFRRGGKQRSSLPIVRTPSKTLERPLAHCMDSNPDYQLQSPRLQQLMKGLVFLQYRNETKRALLPNEITSMDTVKALFVRSFPGLLTMQYLDSIHVRIYIHDAAKDMFYELEDLRDIHDRSVLRIYEQTVNGSAFSHLQEDISYFSEPEFDSEYQHQHIHRSKANKPVTYYNPMTQSYPPISVALTKQHSLERDVPPAQPPPKPQRAFQQPVTSMAKSVRTTPPPGVTGHVTPPPRPSQPSATVPTSQSYYSSPERRPDHHIYPSSTPPIYEEPIYSDRSSYPPSRSGSVTPVIDEQARAVMGARVELMERHLASLTGLVHKALVNPQLVPPLTIQPPDYNRSDYGRIPSGRESVASGSSYRSDSSTRSTPLPDNVFGYDMNDSLRLLKRQSKDLRLEVRNLRRMSQAQAINIRETIRETFEKIKTMLVSVPGANEHPVRIERVKINRDEEFYRQDVSRLEKDLSDLEASVEKLRNDVINRRCRVSMADVESMALSLNKSSKSLADLKTRFPNLQDRMKTIMSGEMEVVVREEKFLKDEPQRLENAFRRCKKLSGTLVTLKRLASVQEHRSAQSASLGLAVDATDQPTPSTIKDNKTTDDAKEQKLTPQEKLENSLDMVQKTLKETADAMANQSLNPVAPSEGDQTQPSAQKVLDALLDELQTFTTPEKVEKKVEFAQTASSKQSPPAPAPSAPPPPPQPPITQDQTSTQVSSTQTTTTIITNASGVSKIQIADGDSKQTLNVSSQGGKDGKSPKVSPRASPLPDIFTSKLSFGQMMKNTVESQTASRRSSVDGTMTIVNGTADSSINVPDGPVQRKKVPPPPPPRTSSRSPMLSPTSPISPGGGILSSLRSGAKPTSPLAATTTTMTTTAAVSHPRTVSEPVYTDYMIRRNTPSCGSVKDQKLTKFQQDLIAGVYANLLKPEPADQPTQQEVIRTSAVSDENLQKDRLSSNSSSSESVNSQEGITTKRGPPPPPPPKPPNLDTSRKTPPTPPSRHRQEYLEQRHQELLKKQKQLQEQYARLQQLQREQQRTPSPGPRASPPKAATPPGILKKPVDTSPLKQSALLTHSTSPSVQYTATFTTSTANNTSKTSNSVRSPNQIYETDII